MMDNPFDKSGTGVRLGRVLRSVAVILLITLACVGLLTLRLLLDGSREMEVSDRAFDGGDLPGAVLHARRAAILYLPGAPHVRAAHARLAAIARGAEAAGERETALAAWRALRAAALETRHLWVGEAAMLRLADENLARLAVAAPGARATTPGEAPVDDRSIVQRAEAELGRDDAPASQWIGLLLAGFGLALAGLFTTGWRAVAADGRLRLSRAKLGLGMSLLGILCSIVAVWKA